MESDEFKGYLRIAEKAIHIASDLANAGPYLGASTLL
jgi:hypothetical protein